MRKFFLNIVSLILPFVGLIIMVNYTIDPNNSLSFGRYESSAAEVLLKKHNIDNFFFFDQRLLLKEVVTHLKVKPEIVVIGTSRSLEISADFFPNKKLLNCSVFNANTNDLIALVGLLDACDKLPSEIYLETTTAYDNTLDNTGWSSLYDYYQYGKKQMQIDFPSTINNIHSFNFKKKILPLVSFEYFQESVKSLTKTLPRNFLDIDTFQPKGLGRFSDLSICYGSRYDNIDTVKVSTEVPIFAAKNSNPKINIAYAKILSEVITYLRKKNVKLYLLNLPFHPDFYNLLEERDSFFYKQKENALAFAKENKISLVGTFSPYDANLTRKNFNDPIHCNKIGLRSVMKIVQYNPEQDK